MTLGLVCDSCDALSPIAVSDCVACGEPLGILLRPDSIPPGRLRPMSGSQPTQPLEPLAPQPSVDARPAPPVPTRRTEEPPRPAPAPTEALPKPAPRTEAPPAVTRPTSPPPPRQGAITQPTSALTAPREAPTQPPVTVRPSSPMRAVSPGPNPLPPPPPGIRRCPTCGDEMPFTHRFCGNCGHRFDGSTAVHRRISKTHFFGPMQDARARLVLIKGEGVDGVSYHLAGAEHIAGRREGAIVFPEDRLLSPRHANFYYREGHLFVRDNGSTNGIFLRIRGPAMLEAGQPFLVGEQLLVARPAPMGPNPPDAHGTYFYGSPRRPARLHLAQLLAGGDVGLVVRCAAASVTIGREGNHVNFPDDPFISGHHAQVTALDDGRFKLDDLRSKNGTFVRIRGEAPLEHGDYVFLGQQLLRVELG